MKTPSRNSHWIINVGSVPQPQFRLFCFPYAGGSASIFRTWTVMSQVSVEVCAIQYPGRERRISEPPFTDMLALVKALAQALIPYLDQCFAFFGHSMGALVSFELARHLRNEYGLSPNCLFVSGCRAPQLPREDPPVHDLPDAELIETLRELAGTPEEILQNSELLALLLPILRADFGIVERYEFQSDEPLDCPIRALGGSEDSIVSRDALQAWQSQTRKDYHLRMFPGGHFFLHDSMALVLEFILSELRDIMRIREGYK